MQNTCTKSDINLLKDIQAGDVPRIKSSFERSRTSTHGRANPNHIREGDVIWTKALYKSPQVLMAAFEAGADANATSRDVATTGLTMLTDETPENLCRADILLAFGATLNDADKNFLASRKLQLRLDPSHKFYIEQVDEGSLARPTQKILKEKYGLTLDKQARTKALAFFGIEEPKPKSRPKPIHAADSEHPHAAALYNAIAVSDPRYTVERIAREVSKGADINGIVNEALPHSPLFYAANSNSKYSIPATDLIWALGGRLNEYDIEFFNITRGIAETDDAALEKWAKQYPQQTGARHLYELLSETVRPELQEVCGQNHISVPLTPAPVISNWQHMGSVFNKIALEALSSAAPKR